MTIKQKLDRLVQAVATYERADMHSLDADTAKGTGGETRHSQSGRGRCPTGMDLGRSARRRLRERDQRSALIWRGS